MRFFFMYSKCFIDEHMFQMRRYTLYPEAQIIFGPSLRKITPITFRQTVHKGTEVYSGIKTILEKTFVKWEKYESKKKSFISFGTGKWVLFSKHYV